MTQHPWEDLWKIEAFFPGPTFYTPEKAEVLRFFTFALIDKSRASNKEKFLATGT